VSMKMSGNLVDSARATRSLEAYLDEQLILAHPDRGCKRHPEGCLTCPLERCAKEKWENKP
jgi:hypothetical protein